MMRRRIMKIVACSLINRSLTAAWPTGVPIASAALQGAQKNDGTTVFRSARLNVAANGAKPSIFFTANEGLFDPQQRGENAVARLAGNVIAKTSDGHELRAPKMEMRLNDAVWLAEKGLTMQGPSGTLRASQLEADDKAGIYRFRNIQMRLIAAGGRMINAFIADLFSSPWPSFGRWPQQLRAQATSLAFFY